MMKELKQKSEIISLSGGGRLAVEVMPGMESFTLGFYFPVGEAYEPNEICGVSHFIEHMLFKGTKRRSAKQIVKAVERVGGLINASTGRELTFYYIRIASHRLELALDVLCDLIFNPAFDASALELEKGVVLEEMRMNEDDPGQALYDRWILDVYGNNPYARPILGTEETITGFDVKKVRKFHSEHYTPSNLVASIAGGIDPDKVHSHLEKKLAQYNSKKKVEIPSPKKPNFRGKISVHSKDVEQAALIVGFPSASLNSYDRYAFSLLDAITAGGMMSRLFQEIREKRGLVYSVDSNHSPSTKTGIFSVEAGMREENLMVVLQLILRELVNLAKKGPGERELADTKEYLKGHWALGLESTSSRMVRNAVSTLFFGEIVSHEEVVAKLDAVTVEDVRKAASKAFGSRGISVGALSRFNNGDGLKDVKEMIKELVSRASESNGN